jgi:hypothetical protein
MSHHPQSYPGSAPPRRRSVATPLSAPPTLLLAPPTLLLALLLALLAATSLASCSDDGGGGAADSSQADSDVTFDGIGETNPDVPDDTGGDDPTEEAGDDAADAVEDTPADATDDGVADSDDDVASDLSIGDQPDDLGTDEYPVCPYESASASIDCTALCGAVVACDGAEMADFCNDFCATLSNLLNEAAANAYAACVTGEGACASVPDGEDLAGYCFVQSLIGLPANPEGSAACSAVDAAIETCTGETSTFGAECEVVVPVLRSETPPLLEECAEAPCESIRNCVSAVACDLLL